jgi:putative hydrolase of the HAD superfamily
MGCWRAARQVSQNGEGAVISAVFFDLDNTLIDDDASTRRSLAATCADLARLVPDLAQQALGEAYYWIAIEVWESVDLSRRNGGQQPVTGLEFRQECWRRALATVGVMDEAVLAEAVARYAAYRDEHLTFFPETEEVLALLRGRLKTGVITNGTADTHRRKLQVLGLEERMDVCIVAGEVGLAKPDAAIFHRASDQLDLPAEECLMVGDNLTSDIGGAKAAGMGAVWMNRGCAPLPHDAPRPDLIIPDLTVLIEVLDLGVTAP